MCILRLTDTPAAKLTFGNPRRGSGEAAYRRGMNLAVGVAYGDRLSSPCTSCSITALVIPRKSEEQKNLFAGGRAGVCVVILIEANVPSQPSFVQFSHFLDLLRTSA